MRALLLTVFVLACATGPGFRYVPIDPPARVRVCSPAHCATLSVEGETENGDPVLLRIPEDNTVEVEERGL